MTQLAATPTAHYAGSSGYRRVTAALCGTGLASFAAMYCTQALLPALSAYYRISPATSALTVSLTTGMLALFVVPASVLSERYGRITVMLISGITSSVIGLLLPFSPTLGVLLVGRALQGVALAGIPAVAMAFLAEEVHASSLGSAMGRYIAGTTIGGCAGRIIPALVLEVSNWRVALLVCSLATLVATLVFAVLVPRSQFFTPKTVSMRATTQNLLVHLRNPVLLRLFALAFTLMGGFVTVYNYLGYRLAAAPFGLAPSIVGLLFLLYLVGTWASVAAGRFADRRGRALVLGIALPSMVAGLLTTLSNALPVIVLGTAVFTGGFFAAHAVASGWVGAVALRDRAEASALYLFSYYLGGSVAGVLGGVVYSVGGWPVTVWFVGTLLIFALLLVTSLVKEAVPVRVRSLS
ncbi:MFS transporter [Mycobacterium montefiorense]|uniref:Transporter n=1 Tax=Mycobacterium montefiorense TaxID=154654 RepID=A0AA37UXK7_9MYCO|nr:MFS transporter [Mycobacterium montefiorense]GBG39774.1 putative transporter [Mycobacterium montefiorense]GKU35645.1 putative transporter [Mycobacterium montefiorense]GKU40650.1 putative transporter [Mycobacterium montefiorense]GKU45153.1 putative transporter [Mycobacterium montefiorense]GKU51303.1 putative transporter [Mycobacterium montefiorense]